MSDDVVTLGCWEGAVPGSGGELVGQVGTFLTCMTYAGIKYSRLIGGDEHSVAAVERKDVALCNCFPDPRILRVDELLYGEWEDLQETDHQSQRDSFDNLACWLRGKEDRYWAVISNIHI